MTLAELFAWAYDRPDPSRILDAIAELRSLVDVLDFDADSAKTYGGLRADLKRLGMTVSPPDLIIASTAVANGLAVVTHNTAHFATIPGLDVDDWLSP